MIIGIKNMLKWEIMIDGRSVHMKKVDEKLQLKKQTLIAWTNILLAKGMIDLAKCNRMKSMIEKMTV